MQGNSRQTASAAVALLLLLVAAAAASAQGVAPSLRRVALVTAGSIGGVVHDETGAAVAGALVSALGVTSASTFTDRAGRFELRALPPGLYVLRARLNGFAASGERIVQVRASTQVDSSIALRRVSAAPGAVPPPPVLAAGMAPSSQPEGTAESPVKSPVTGEEVDPADQGSGELVRRLRNARRGVLKEVAFPDELLAELPSTLAGSVFGSRGRSAEHLAVGWLAGMPFSGQLNLLTIGSMAEDGREVFATNSFSRSTAYFALGTPVGNADWTMRGALTDGDRPSWFAAAAYTTRVPARHRYDLGLSYSTQRYDSGNPATFALRDVAERGHYAGSVYAFDTLALGPSVSVTYGGRFARYDYLEGSGLLSPRVAVTITPAKHFRVTALASRRALAPGAEEFLPPVEPGLWLPPQRTFSSLVEGQPLGAERTTHLDVEAARDLGESTVSVRVFHQHVDDQLVTLFGSDRPAGPGAHLGHYFVSNSGDLDATGWSAGLRTAFADRVRGSLEYSRTTARWDPTATAGYLVLLAPSTRRLESESVHDLATSVETDVPETATRVLVVYRLSTGFARPVESEERLASRFDVQVRQPLSFMDFGTARWEMLLAVRNFFREASLGSSVYDELLVIHPPKRVVGGLTLKF
jgi:hypothetical protein